MSVILHVNIPDAKGEVYCCLRNRIVALDEEHRLSFCGGCKMYAGGADGQGVACAWDDARELDNPHLVTDPRREWSSNQAKTTPTPTAPPDWGPGQFVAAEFV